MVWKITFTTLGDLPWLLLFLFRTCVTALLGLRQCQLYIVESTDFRTYSSKTLMNMLRKCYNHRLQIDPKHCEEKTHYTGSHKLN